MLSWVMLMFRSGYTFRSYAVQNFMPFSPFCYGAMYLFHCLMCAVLISVYN
jgi:hypothetical protein